MRLSDAAAMRALIADARHARLATIAADGRAHLVPIVFAFAEGSLVTPVDHKPKSTKDLARLANIRRDPRATVLVDNYEDDWSALWWVRADGTARILDGGEEFERAAGMLTEKYEQYRGRDLDGPIVVIEPERWTGWRAS